LLSKKFAEQQERYRGQIYEMEISNLCRIEKREKEEGKPGVSGGLRP
jgi:hypothetical protein